MLHAHLEMVLLNLSAIVSLQSEKPHSQKEGLPLREKKAGAVNERAFVLEFRHTSKTGSVFKSVNRNH